MIPTTWVFQSTDDFDKTTIFCKWPPGSDQDVTSETIRNTTVPTDDWSSYKIRMLDNGKEYCKYCKIKYLSNYCIQVSRYINCCGVTLPYNRGIVCWLGLFN